MAINGCIDTIIYIYILYTSHASKIEHDHRTQVILDFFIKNITILVVYICLILFKRGK